MSKKTLSYAEVASIADKIKSQGKMPSLWDISSELKQTKISSKLLHMLEKWYQQLNIHEKNTLYDVDKEVFLPSYLPCKYETISKSLSLLQSIFEFSSTNSLVLHVDEIKAINQKFSEINQCLQLLATHDELTDLPNNVFFMRIAEKCIQLAEKNKENIAFLFLDLDDFKIINHRLGYPIGNKVLAAIASRLLMMNDKDLTVARYGGDEFVILIPKMKFEDAEQIAAEIMQVLKIPFKIEEQVIRLSASIGISIYPEHGKECEALVNHAEISMYHAKEKGSGQYQLFSQEINRAKLNHKNLSDALQNAIKRNELYLVYQPVINFKKHCVDSVEALLRWHSPQYGHVSPLEFIPIAESSDLIFKIGEWVLEQACLQTVHWHKLGLKNLTVAVNLSGRQLHQPNLLNMVIDILEKTELPARFLEFELTENMFIETTEEILDTLQKFKNMGIKLAIDDFGTGYSCLSYLKRFPVDKIKIDRAFVNDLARNPNNAVIIKTIIRLGHHLNLKILVEGIENVFQKKFVMSHGCDYGQGFYFQAPEKPDALFEFLQQQAP